MTSSKTIKSKLIYCPNTTKTTTNRNINKSRTYDKTRMKRDRDLNNKPPAGLPGAVAHFYYKHGLFLSSYPTCATSIAIVAILFACYPLINIPLPGTIPTKIVLPFEGSYTLSNKIFAQNFTTSQLPSNPFHQDAIKTNNNNNNKNNYSKSKIKSTTSASTSTTSSFGLNGLTTTTTTNDEGPGFKWAQRSPMLYVQQITLRAGVLPWSSELQLMDAFRAPLYEIFKLLEIVRNHEIKQNGRTLDDICLRVDNVKRIQNEGIFPEYDCLILSPANLWSQNIEEFTNDANLLNTIFQYHNLQKTKVSVAEMLFGLPMQDTGIKRYPIKTRSRVIQYAVTLILKQNDPEYLHSLKEKLLKIYAMPNTKAQDQETTKHEHNEKSTITYIFYPGEFRLIEFLPLTIAFCVLLMYIYFSVRKIDIIHSRVLLAFSAMITVLGSLVMSLGICFFFGLTISLQSKDIFPYLVILLGLENCLVITKSVVSTSETFDNKIRVAQALSKEGWNISKTLLTEITILTIGLATFVPVIQEFCVFAIVALLSDFLLQMLFFSTILAMNIKRTEYTVEARHLPKMMFTANGSVNNALLPQGRHDFRFFAHTAQNGVTFQRSQSHPKLALGDFALNEKHHNNHNNNNNNSNNNNNNNGNNNTNGSNDKRIPKRLRLVNFWARTRFFQRAFMLWMIVWIFSIVYNSGCLEHLFAVGNGRGSSSLAADKLQRNIAQFFSHIQATSAAVKAHTNNNNNMEAKKAALSSGGANTTQMQRLLYPDYELNYFLSNFHWSTIMKQYNISLSGRYVTILPSIKLSMAISAEAAAGVRNPHEKIVQNFQWKALAAALDPLDFNDDESHEFPLTLAEAAVGRTGGSPLFPKSPMEIFFAIMLACISISVLCYTMVVFYRCICTRNYAEWRSSWYESYEGLPTTNEQILEGVPTRISGHKHRIECLVSDSVHIISCCLQGQIKIWDVRSGEEVNSIDRHNMQLSNSHYVRTPIWCIDYFDDLIAAGCANGRIELWEATTGNLKCAYHEEGKRNLGITHIYLNGDRVIVARLCGRLDFYRLETYCKGKQIDWCFTSAYKRTHVRTGSTGSIGTMKQQQSQHGCCASNDSSHTSREEMKCVLTSVRLAHQQPITCMEVANGMVFTGSQDHTLKVYSLSDSDMEYTLHSHCGPITCLFVDRWQPGTGGSGSRDGLLCVWDLFTGACMYTIQAHDGAISCLACAPSYVISLGTDDRICVWERFQGNLLTTINISNAFSSLLMLTPSLLVTSKPGSLIVWDVRTGEPAREVKLDRSNTQLCPKYMMLTHDSVICDYGNEIRAVRFPIVAMDKCN